MSEDTTDYILDKISKLELDIHYLQVAMEHETILVKRRKLHEDCILPTQAYENDAGHDIYSIEDVELPFGIPVKVKTGLSLQLPQGYYVSIRDRSGLGSKGIHVLGGVVDCDYTGEYCVILVNLNQVVVNDGNGVSRSGWGNDGSNNMFLLKNNEKQVLYTLPKGSKIAQLVFSRVPSVVYSDSEFEDRTRGKNGFGSSGK